MITAMVLAATLLQPIRDKTWRRTEGAEVMQEADQNVCALFVFQQKDAAVGFFWDKAGLTSIVFFNEQWNFPPSETTVAVRIGNNWISENGGIDWFQATEKEQRSGGSYSLSPRRELVDQRDLGIAPPPGCRR